MTPPDYRLVRSDRKTLSLSVGEDGAPLVRAPRFLAKSRIDAFVEEHREWLQSQVGKALERQAAREAFEPERLLLLGREVPVLRQGKQAQWEKGRFLLPPGPWEEARPGAERVYRELARRELGARVELWSKRMGLFPRSVRITGAKARWGSCSGKGGVCFSWFLVMAPPSAVDYVVIHELCHLKEHNHSSRFWALVGRHCPDYPAQREALRLVQERLGREPW